MDFTHVVLPLITLVVLEIILGIDNVIFISILADKLPKEQRKKLRQLGIGLAMVMRLVLLTLISWIMKLDNELFNVMDISISGKDIILLAGGLFLIYKSTREIYLKSEEVEHHYEEAAEKKKVSFKDMLFQILLLDIVFSIDSIITAVGMVDQLWIMYVAVIISVGIMLFASGPISRFISEHPSFKVLALCFLLIIGMSLIGEGLDFHIPKGYIYFSMAFAFFVDFIQMKTVKTKKAEAEAKAEAKRSER
ncbi:MAG TPA: TerC family protein [Saprospiraceae bacterium]|jgi:predicted tellurium resistance membrane protein TerC